MTNNDGNTEASAPRTVEIRIAGEDINLLMSRPKWDLVRYARKVQAALPHETIYTSGRKADIAWSILSAVARNPV